ATDEHLVVPTNTSCVSDGVGGCSLRGAIEAANNAGGTSTINLPAPANLSVPAAEYDLTLGALVVGTYPGVQTSYDIAIVGLGTAANTLVKQTSAPSDRVFDIDPTIAGGVTASIANVTVRGGTDKLDGFGGGGIIGGSSTSTPADALTLTGIVLDGNSTITHTPAIANSYGGGLQVVGGNLTITNSTVSNNSGDAGSGGGVYYEDQLGTGTVSVTGSTFTGNTLDDTTSGPALLAGGGGLAIKGVTGTSATVNNDTFTNNTAKSTGNTAPVTGGGVYLQGPGSITHSTFTGNHADGATDPNNLDGGGAISASSGTITIQHNRVTGNAASNGPKGLLDNLVDATTNVTATDDWWGCNTPPSGAGCDTIFPTASQVKSVFNPWVVLTASASPSKIRINQSTVITAQLKDSNGLTLADTSPFVGLPITFDTPVLGTIVGPEPKTLNASLAATDAYDAGTAGGDGSFKAHLDAGSATGSVTVLQPPSITTSFSPTRVAVGAASTVTLGVTNGNTVAIAGSLTDTLPAGLVVAATPAVVNTCGGAVVATAGSGSISWVNSTLAVGSCSVKVNVSASVDNDYSNSVTIDSSDAGNGNTASSTLTVINPPNISKQFGSASIPLNGTTSLTLDVDNTGNVNQTLNGIAFTDSLPAGTVVASPGNLSSTCAGTATAADGSSTVSLSGVTLAPGVSCTVSLDVQGTTAGGKNNSVQATSTNGGTSATSTASTTVVAPPTIAKEFGASSIPLEGTTSLTFTVTNPNATASLSGVAFTDTLPAGLVIATPNGETGTCLGTITATAGTGAVSLSGGLLEASTGCTFSVDVTGTAAGLQSNTTGAVTATEGGTGGTASASVTVEAPPSIDKAFDPASIALGATTSLTFTITNPAANVDALTGVGFTDTLPSGLTVPGASATVCGGTVTLTAPASISLAGATVATSGTCQFSVTVTGASAGQYTNTTGSVTSTNGGTGNTASANLTVVAPPTLSKAFTPSSIPLGGITKVLFVITNPNAGSDLSGVAFDDTLPSGLVVAPTPGAVDTCGGTLAAAAGASTLSLSGGSVTAAAQTCIVSVLLQGVTAGAKLNTTGAISSTEGGTGTTSNTADLTVVAPPTIAKAFGAASIPLDGSTSLSFTVTNPNTTASLSGIAFSDTLPAGLVVSTPNGLSGSCGGGTITAIAGSGAVSLSGATLAASGTCTFSVDVTGSAAGLQTNVTGNVTSTEGGTGGTATASVTVEAPPSIAKAFNPNPIALGATTSLTFTITNPAANGGALTGVAFTDTLPTGLTVPSATATVCGGTVTLTAPASISMTGATIAPSSVCEFSVTVTGAASGQYINTTGSVSSTNGGTGNTATADLTVASPPTITKSFGAPAVPLNGTTTLTFDIGNPNAGVALTGVAFTDSLPAGMAVASAPNLTSTCGGTATAVGGSGSVALSGDTLAAGGSCVVSVDVQGTTAGTKNNSVQVSSTEGGTGNTSNASATVVAPPTIAKAFGAASIPLGGSTSLTFTITNPNTTAGLSGVAVTDALPAGLVVSTPNGLSGSCGSGILSAAANSNLVDVTGATLAASASCTFSVNVTGAGAGLQTNVTGSVTSTEGGTGGTATASVTVEAPPSIAKAFSPNPISLDATTSLTFTITNPAGNVSALTGVAFTDTLPTGLTVPSATATVCGGTVTLTAPASIAMTGATIAPSSQCVFSVTVTGAASGQYTNTTGSVSSTNGGTGNTASANLTVASPPSITKSFGAATVPVNGTTTLTFDIANPNTGVALTGVAFTDSLPAGMVVASTPNLASTCGGTATAVGGSGSVTLSGGTLAASGSCSVSVDVRGTTVGTKNNSVQVGSTEGGTGNTSTASIVVVSPPTIAKAFGAASIPLGGSTSLTFTITNPNTTVGLGGVAFTDTLPVGLVVSTPNGLSGSCGAGSITATAGSTTVSLGGGTVSASGTCTFSVNVTGSAAGAMTNTTAAVTSTQGGTGNTATASIHVEAPPAIAKAFGAADIRPGSTTTLTFTITNPAGNVDPLTAVGVTDTLPSGLTVASASTAACGGTLTTTAPATIALTGATIATGSQCQFTVTITGAASGDDTNVTAAVTSANGGTGSTATAHLFV
ncbi:MAG TPA: hypothetical protein VFO60_00400, partial [Candidatus Dormibacteraeota bacterium]|nr:hypothetical protein [Candidatus Dormibacteraeota bacterium]